MSQIIIPQRRVWTQQPPPLTGVCQANPLVRGLVFAWEATEPTCDPISGLRATLSAGNTAGVGKYGIQRNFSGSQSEGSFSFGEFSGLTGKTSATWELLFYLDNVSQSAKIFSQWNDFYQNWLIQASTTSLIWVPCDSDGLGRTRFDLANAFPSAGWYRLILAWGGGSVKQVIVNGVDKTSSVSTVSSDGLVGGANLDPLQIGVARDSPLNGAVVFARIWNRGLSTEEVSFLSSNPWQIFAKRDRIAFINTTGGSASYTITPTGSISLSGISTQIKNKIFQASVTVNLTGSASLSLTNGAIEYTISPTGSITYSGTYKARVVRALSPSGTITYSGNAIRATTHIQTSSGLITFSGNAPLYIPGSYIPTTSILLTGVGK